MMGYDIGSLVHRLLKELESQEGPFFSQLLQNHSSELSFVDRIFSKVNDWILPATPISAASTPVVLDEEAKPKETKPEDATKELRLASNQHNSRSSFPDFLSGFGKAFDVDISPSCAVEACKPLVSYPIEGFFPARTRMAPAVVASIIGGTAGVIGAIIGAGGAVGAAVINNSGGGGGGSFTPDPTVPFYIDDNGNFVVNDWVANVDLSGLDDGTANASGDLGDFDTWLDDFRAENGLDPIKRTANASRVHSLRSAVALQGHCSAELELLARNKERLKTLLVESGISSWTDFLQRVSFLQRVVVDRYETGQFGKGKKSAEKLIKDYQSGQNWELIGMDVGLLVKQVYNTGL